MPILASDSTIIGNFLLVALLVFLVIWAFALTRRLLDFGGEASLVTPSILILLAASAVAAFAWPALRTQGFCESKAMEATYINYAAGLALLCGLFGSVAVRYLRRDPRKLAAALVVAAALLSLSAVLVSFDSATYTVYTPEQGGDMFDCPSYGGDTVIHHVTYLYFMWGIAAALLLVQAARAVLSTRLRSETEDGSGEDDDGSDAS